MAKRASTNATASKGPKVPKIDPTVIHDFDQRLKVLQSDVRTLKASSAAGPAQDPEPDNLVVEFKDRDGHAVLIPKLIRQHKLSDHEHWTRTEKVIRWLYDKNIKLTTNNIKLCGVGAGTFHKVRVKAKKLIARLEMERNLILKAQAAAQVHAQAKAAVIVSSSDDDCDSDSDATQPLRGADASWPPSPVGHSCAFCPGRCRCLELLRSPPGLLDLDSADSPSPLELK